MDITRRHLTAGLALSGLFSLSNTSFAKGKAKHNSGHKLLGQKIKTKGRKVIDKKGPHTVSVDVQNEKIVGLNVKHDTKGELPVKKYKTTKKMAQAEGLRQVSYIKVQDQYLGTTYIGYSYFDEYGDEEIYWFPYEMILDGDTGAIEYIPIY